MDVGLSQTQQWGWTGAESDQVLLSAMDQFAAYPDQFSPWASVSCRYSLIYLYIISFLGREASIAAT